MDCITRPLRGALVVGLSIFGLAHSTRAALIEFNSDNGEVRVAGAPVSSLNGASFTSTNEGDLRRWYFAGDLNFGATDHVSAIGVPGISIIIGNNLTIAPGSTFDFSAFGKNPGPGGGTGGLGGSSSNGGSGGAGGDGGYPEKFMGAAGGAGGTSTIFKTFGASGGGG